MGSTLPPACRGRRRPRRSRGSAVAPRAGFVGRQDELAILSERFSEAARGRPQVVYLEGEAGSGKSTLLSRFLGSLSDAVVLQAGGDEDESLLSYGVVDQLDPDAATDPGDDPMAVGATALPRLRRGRRPRHAGGSVLPMSEHPVRGLRAVLDAAGAPAAVKAGGHLTRLCPSRLKSSPAADGRPSFTYGMATRAAMPARKRT